MTDIQFYGLVVVAILAFIAGKLNNIEKLLEKKGEKNEAKI